MLSQVCDPRYDMCSLQIQETSTLIRTILEVQPRLSSGGGGKATDEIVFELADSILNKVAEKLDLDNARADMFDVSCYIPTELSSVQNEFFGGSLASRWKPN